MLTHQLHPHLKISGKDRARYALGRVGASLMRRLPAELAHDLTLWGLERGLFDRLLTPRLKIAVPELRVQIPGIGTLKHPVGLAAGFDKNARCPTKLVRMGFSFLELGTVTPRPQPGNSKPRLFRLADQSALVNSFGFNSEGVAKVANRLGALHWQHDDFPLGVNVGKNKETKEEQAIDDYVQCIELLQNGLGRYFVCNLSSPNTPGLRQLASLPFISMLGQRLGARFRAQTWIKLSPDHNKGELQKLVGAISEAGFQGVILTNTHMVQHNGRPAGISGHPLALRAGTCLEWAHEVHKGELPMIAVGGIFSGFDAFERIRRGASAVQIYTSLVYRGPWTPMLIALELLANLKEAGFANVSEAIGSFYE